MTILVVDDQPNLARVSAMALRVLGCQTQVAHSIAAAKVVLARDKVDAVFLDVNLRGENGFDYLSTLTARPGRLPVVMFTAEAQEEIAAEARGRGAFDCLVKPFDLADLRRQVERLREFLHPEAPVRPRGLPEQ